MNTERGMLQDAFLSQVQVEFGALSHRGKVRLTNEDHYLVAAFERSMRAFLTSLPEDEIPDHYADTGYGMLVADGMGGALGGEVASRTAINTLIELALRTPDWIMRLNEELTTEVLHRMSRRIEQVDTALLEKARLDPSLAGMGTTITIACSVGANLLVAHVGDSRAYLFRDNRLYRLTRDHTVAQSLVNAGVIEPEEVESHPMRSMLTHMAGSTGGQAQADLGALQLADGDQVLLSTDGLTDMVSETAIAEALGRPRFVNQTCRDLIEMALEGGGQDNITVILARYRLPH